MVFYESVHRIAASLADMVDAFGADRPAFIGRELTKMHEQCVQARLGELQSMVDVGTIVSKGEFVVVVTGGEGRDESTVDADQLLELLSQNLGARDAARIAAELTGRKKNALYERLLEIRGESR